MSACAACLASAAGCALHAPGAAETLDRIAALADAGWEVSFRRRDTMHGAPGYVAAATLPARLADEVTTYHGAPTLPDALAGAWAHALAADPTLPR